MSFSEPTRQERLVWWNTMNPDVLYDLTRHWRAPHVSERKLRLFACAVAREGHKLLARVRNPRTAARHLKPIEVAEAFADGRVKEADRLGAGQKIPGPKVVYCFCVFKGAGDAARDACNRGGKFMPTQSRRAAIFRDVVACPYDKIQPILCQNCHGSGQFFVGWGRGWQPCESCENGRAPEGWWMTKDIHKVALAIYEERAFERLPVLADLAEEAGYRHGHVLNHLRGRKPCWNCAGTRKVDVRVLKDSNDPTAYVAVDCEACQDGFTTNGQPHVPGCWALDMFLGRETK